MAETLWGHSPAGLFGYTHLLGGYAGGQAEYLRVPYADVGPIKVPSILSDEQVPFLSDIFPTGYMGADFCDIQPRDTIAVFGCGPVGQFSVRSAFLLGAERVIAIDTLPEPLALTKQAGAITIDFGTESVHERINELTHGRGAGWPGTRWMRPCWRRGWAFPTGSATAPSLRCCLCWGPPCWTWPSPQP